MKIFKAKKFALEMGYTRKEFLGLLASQDKLIYQQSVNSITFLFLDQQLIVTLGEEGVRKIASARVPKLNVSFDFSKMDADTQEQFMKIFFMKFQRGGG